MFFDCTVLCSTQTNMRPGSTLKALFKLNECGDRLTNLKRLVLIFDECHYLPAETHPLLEGEPVDGGFVRRRDATGTEVVEPFDFFTHAGQPLRYEDESLHDEELRDALAELREAKIAFRATPNDEHQFDSKAFHLARNALAAAEATDEEFLRLSETSQEQLTTIKIKEIHFQNLLTGEKYVNHLLRAPNAIVDSFDITDVLTAAYQANACPVFIDSHHRSELRHRYNRMKDGMDEVAKSFPQLAAGRSIQGAFGQVSFNVASEIFHADTIATRKVSELIKYRDNMQDVRRRYVAGDLMELTAAVEADLWSEAMQREIQKYVMGKLAKDLAVYRQTMQETWEKMFGGLSAGVVSAVRTGGAGGILGQLLPHTTLWEMALLGTIGGLLKEAPALTRTIVESILAARAQRRNAIAYIAEFK